VTQADHAVEEMARAKVASSGLALDVLGEEMGGADAKAASASGRARLIIDPIDGTEEFSRGIPTFGTLLGIERDGEIVAGIASAPGLATRWSGYRGQGAYRNGKQMHVSTRASLDVAMVFCTGTGPKKTPVMRAKLRRIWQHMLVAQGSIEAAVDLTSMPWDLAPLGLIVEEAGGRSTNVRGERTIYTGEFVSTNGLLHDQILAILS